MQWILALVARNVRLSVVLGKTLFLAGAILILGAVFARAALVNLNAQRAEAGLTAFQALAAAYPHHPTWIVPEGPVGYAVAALLVLVGMGLTSLATEAARRERTRRGQWW
jgi:hypothetical protein